MASSKQPETDDAIDILMQDHREVDALFKQLDSAEDSREKIDLAQHICMALTIHAQVEEEIFYPAARKALDADDAEMVAEATVEHRSLKQLIAAINGESADDSLFNANLTVLKEYVRHHVKEEETQLMPAVQRAGVDLVALGQKISARKNKLKDQLEEATPSESARSKPRVRLPELSAKRKAASTPVVRAH